MTGGMALLGSGEFLPVMRDVDRHLLARLGMANARVAVLPTAAGQEGNASVNRWATMGVEHFRALGASVDAVRIVDRTSALDAACVEPLRRADLVYFSGGDPIYLHATLQGTPAWEAVLEVMARGGIYAGCSAGAMIMGERIFNVRNFLRVELVPGFGLLPGTTIVPHFDRIESFRPGALGLLRMTLPKGLTAVGIDEDTAMVSEAGRWTVMGRGAVWLITKKSERRFANGETLTLS